MIPWYCVPGHPLLNQNSGCHGIITAEKTQLLFHPILEGVPWLWQPCACSAPSHSPSDRAGTWSVSHLWPREWDEHHGTLRLSQCAQVWLMALVRVGQPAQGTGATSVTHQPQLGFQGNCWTYWNSMNCAWEQFPSGGELTTMYQNNPRAWTFMLSHGKVSVDFSYQQCLLPDYPEQLRAPSALQGSSGSFCIYSVRFYRFRAHPAVTCFPNPQSAILTSRCFCCIAISVLGQTTGLRRLNTERQWTRYLLISGSRSDSGFACFVFPPCAKLEKHIAFLRQKPHTPADRKEENCLSP